MSLIKKLSIHSVKDTMDKFEALAISKGMTIFARIDHKENAEGVGIELNNAEVLIFGNPKGGSMIMKKDIAVALDLPLRVAVYEDDKGHVFLSYHNQFGLAGIYDVEGLPGLKVVTEALDTMSNSVVGV